MKKFLRWLFRNKGCVIPWCGRKPTGFCRVTVEGKGDATLAYACDIHRDIVTEVAEEELQKAIAKELDRAKEIDAAVKAAGEAK